MDHIIEDYTSIKKSLESYKTQNELYRAEIMNLNDEKIQIENKIIKLRSKINKIFMCYAIFCFLYFHQLLDELSFYISTIFVVLISSLLS